jgi:nucleoside-diphosphate-sugar epimerase
MKVVVTGGSGQVGSVVLERLAAQRKVKRIVSLDLVPPRVASPKVEYRIADIRDPGLERHLEGAQALVHLAFIVTAPASSEAMHTVNVEGSRRLFEAASLHGLQRVVYTSSVAAYGLFSDHPGPIAETAPRRRTGFLTYADNKYDVEEFLDRFEREHP